MRTLGAIALVLVTGCSLVWNMDPYERGAGASDNRDGREGASSSSSSGGSSSGEVSSSTSSGGSSGIPSFDAGDAAQLEAGTSLPDASFDAGGSCADEEEPNGSAADSTEPDFGTKTCGVISSLNDEDFFYIPVGKPKTIFIELGVNVRVLVSFGNGELAFAQTPGMKTVNLPPGDNMFKFEVLGSQAGGAYTIIVPP